MAVRSGWLAAVAALLVAPPAPAGRPMNPTVVREMSRPGPCTVELQGKGTLRVPTGFRYVGPDRLADFHDHVGDPPPPAGELGAVVPDDGTFVVYLSLVADPKADPLTGLAPADVPADGTKTTLLKWTEAAVADASARRAAAGLGTQKVMGWTHTPAYDEATKRLTLGVRLIDEAAGPGEKDELHHRTYVYGPDKQVVLLRLVTAQFKKLDPSLEATKQLAGELTLTEPADAVDRDEVLHYAKIGGAGLLGVGLALLGAKLLLGGKPPRSAAAAARPTRKFGSPR